MQVLAAPAFSNQKVNPYNALLYQELNHLAPVVEEYSHRKALFTQYDILHFHWPDGYVNEPSLLKALQRIVVFGLIMMSAKLKGAQIVWTVHNIFPHDCYHPQLSQKFMRWFVKHCDGLIFMSEQGRQDFGEHYVLTKDKVTAIIPHGHYRPYYCSASANACPAASAKASDAAEFGTANSETAKQQARQQLDLPLDKTVLLSFGLIKSYKNIEQLLKVFIHTELHDCILLIAGHPESTELAQAIESLGIGHPRIKLCLQFIPDSEVSLYHDAADIAILPYKQILNSGALLLALSFNKPVIAPHIGAFATMQQELGPEWIQTYTGELSSENLSMAIQAVSQYPNRSVCPLDNFDWDHLAQLTLNFYQNLNQAA